MIRGHSALCAALLALVCAIGGAAAAAPAATKGETIVFVRHGEKPPLGLGQLDCQGLNRALALPAALARQFGKPAFIFAPNPGEMVRDHGRYYNYVRPLATIEPTAIRLGMPVDTRFGFEDTGGLERELLSPRYRDSLLFVAWEHGMLVKLVRQLLATVGADPSVVPDWPEDDFDSIYILRLQRAGAKIAASFTRGQEGLNGRSTTCPD
jgi:hypothetical protein